MFRFLNRYVRVEPINTIQNNPINNFDEYDKYDKYIEPIKITDNLECSICIGTNESNKYCKISCEHSFHNNCIKQWLIQSKTCPNCKSNLIILPNKYNKYNELVQQIYLETTEFFTHTNKSNIIILSNLITYRGICKCKYTYIKINNFAHLKLNLEIIFWYLETYTKNINNSTYIEYLKNKNLFGVDLFNIFKCDSDSNILNNTYDIYNIKFSITLAQANFFQWFFKSNILEKIIDDYKLFLLPNLLYQQ